MAKKPKVKKEWSYKGYIFGALRRIFRWSPERKGALKNAEKDGKYVCAKCGELFSSKQIAVDHIEPVVSPEKGFETWDIYITRLFVTRDKLQVLCKTHHSEKTKQENQIRRKAA